MAKGLGRALPVGVAGPCYQDPGATIESAVQWSSAGAGAFIARCVPAPMEAHFC